MNELSPVNDGIEGTWQGDCQDRRNCQRVKIEEFTAKDAKSAKQEEQDGTAEVAESAEKEELNRAAQSAEGKEVAADFCRHAQIGNGSADGALPPSPSHELKDLQPEIPEDHWR
jgi:hypothetical protein